MMTAPKIQELFNKYGYDNLIYIQANNNRRMLVDDKLRATMVWDHDNEILIFEEDNYVLHEMRDYSPRKVVIAAPYEALETFIFAREEKYKLNPHPENV